MAKSHSLLRLTESIINKPQLISPESFENVLNYLTLRNESGLKDIKAAIDSEQFKQPSERYLDFLSDGKTAIIPIQGNLIYEESWMDALCGITSYIGLEKNVKFAAERGVEHIIYDVNSGGGMAYGMFECADNLRKICNTHGIKTHAYVDGTCASAAFGLAVHADEIIVNPQAKIGSVGVVLRLTDISEMQKKVGVKDIYVFAGDNKIPFNSEGKFTERFLAGLQEDVDYLYEGFTSHVAKYRSMLVQDVINTQADMFRSEEALTVGFADKIMTRSDFVQYVTNGYK